MKEKAGSEPSSTEALREAVRHDRTGHRVNLLFDHEDEKIRVTSPYTGGKLSIRVKEPAPLHVRIPPWVDRDAVRVEGVTGEPQWSNDYLVIADPPPDGTITIDFELASQEIVMQHRTREIRVRLRGDEVVGMDNFGTDATFFHPLD